MKGIILAGGTGTRLYPITKAISKQIVPIYDKPMIYYPLSVLMMIGIRDILIISTERDIKVFRELLYDGKDLGINISYKIQKKPRGIAEAFILGEEFIENDEVALILGDNIFYGDKLEDILTKAKSNLNGATIFAASVNNPSEFGIVEFDKDNKAISLEEKPKNPKSNYAIPGLYFYDNDVVDISKSIKPSLRGELEITSVNEVYLNKEKLMVSILDKNIMWLDTGTHDNLLKASNNIKSIQKAEGKYIGCIEEIAFRKGYITKDKFINLILNNTYGEYREYLLRISEE